MKSRVKQNQEVSGKDNQVAGQYIHNNCVNLSVNLPASEEQEAWCREIESYKKFRKEIGIECSHPARHALSSLLASHNFTPRQIRTVWRNTTLKYDDELRHLVSSPSKIQAGLGIIFFVFGLLMVLPAVGHFLMSPKSESVFMPVFAVYVLMLAVLSKQLIAPYYIGRRLQRALEAEKQKDQAE